MRLLEGQLEKITNQAVVGAGGSRERQFGDIIADWSVRPGVERGMMSQMVLSRENTQPYHTLHARLQSSGFPSHQVESEPLTSN